ncbi:hypothetical protein [Oceanobacillus sp. FSL H7-0719]|uniref:hypothetical protein n=1 Tax=Oceanobacillus sp. FSL H7-0719 TaxID=2954507 RepID=UPI0032456A28
MDEQEIIRLAKENDDVSFERLVINPGCHSFYFTFMINLMKKLQCYFTRVEVIEKHRL